jgi:hypothetical protein
LQPGHNVDRIDITAKDAAFNPFDDALNFRSGFSIAPTRALPLGWPAAYLKESALVKHWFWNMN